MQLHDVNERAVQSGEVPPALPVRAFLSGRAEDLPIDLLAYALYARHREARGPAVAEAEDHAGEDPVLRYRRQAEADLATFALRLLHNRAEEIRLAAVREHLGGLPRPPGFARLVVASMLGVSLVGAAALWAMGQGGLIAEMAARAAAAVRGFAP